ncbi:MAG: pyridoxal 5'-phosphate synthase glutaminase subunit PdxT [Candidatus Gracilibacteria bacterium]|nr:pyridoxal 5'-phosphate synthase glutaminase subunit PdxT [Candidatus Gracilibacteria bacterium]
MIGVLALQGDFKEHITSVRSHGYPACEVRTISELKACDALILPGGESTTIAKLLLSSGLDKGIIEFMNLQKKPVWGTCAGAILLAENVLSPTPLDTGLSLLNITVERNAYGRQTESCHAKIQIEKNTTDVFFIRAPKIVECGKSVEVLAEYQGSPVMVRSGRVLASTFHSEVYGENKVLEIFIKMMKKS